MDRQAWPATVGVPSDVDRRAAVAAFSSAVAHNSRTLHGVHLTEPQRAAASELWRSALEAGVRVSDQLHLVVTKWASGLPDNEATELSKLGGLGLDWLGLIAVADALAEGRNGDEPGVMDPF